MVEWLTILFDSRISLQINAWLGFLFWAFLYFSIFQKRERMKEGGG